MNPQERRLRLFWTVCMVALGVVLLYLALTPGASIASRWAGSPWFLLVLGGLAFLAEYVDSSLGMGYGTTLTPLLMLFGYSPLAIVPAVLCSEFLTGVASGWFHHRIGNVDLRRGTDARRTTHILAFCSLVGTVVAVIVAVNLPKTYLKAYIGIMVFALGLFILLGRSFTGGFSPRKILGVGLIAAFNKGLSGGGYGPVVTGGQVLAGVPEKHAVGITSLAEGLVCCVALGLYLALGESIDVALAVPLTLGALLSVPAAAWTVKLMPVGMLRRAIGYATLFLGTLILVRIVV